MVPLRVAATLALVVLPLASASLVEDETGATYQFDAGTSSDAPNSCAEASPEWQVPVDGHVHGMVIPEEDPVDFIVFDVTADLVGDRLSVIVSQADLGGDLFANVFVPGCGATIFADESQPIPSKEPQPGPGQVSVSPHNMDKGDGSCGSGQWQFVITKLDGFAVPATIYMEWSNGDMQDVPLEKVTPAATASYHTSYNVVNTVRKVVAILPAEWAGSFNLGKRPCDLTDAGAVFGEPATRVGNVMEFTPIEAGLFAVEIRFVPPEEPNPMEPVVVPASCHNCVPGIDGGIDPIEYDLSVGDLF